jgi:hypothetical protein
MMSNRTGRRCAAKVPGSVRQPKKQSRRAARAGRAVTERLRTAAGVLFAPASHILTTRAALHL